MGFYLVPYCQPSPPTPMEYATPASLEWHVCPGRRSIYNTCLSYTYVDITVSKWDIATKVCKMIYQFQRLVIYCGDGTILSKTDKLCFIYVHIVTNAFRCLFYTMQPTFDLSGCICEKLYIIFKIYVFHGISSASCLFFSMSPFSLIWSVDVGTIYPTPPLGQDMTLGQFLSGV